MTQGKTTRHPEFGFLRTASLPSEQELEEHYREKYFQTGAGNYKRQYSSEEILSLELPVKLALHAFQFLEMDWKAPKALDLGCGEGFASRVLQELGFEVTLVDASSEGLSKQNPQLLEKFTQADTSKFFIDNEGPWDLIWLSHVLEHVLDPEALLSGIHASLTQSGRAIITIPNDDSRFQSLLLAEGFVSREWWIAPPEHLSYFNVDTFSNLATKKGFEIEKVFSSLPIDWALLNPTSNYVETPKIGAFAHNANLALERYLRGFDLSVHLQLRETLAELQLGRNLTFVLKKPSRS
jgi:2-polyprenyl-3-methyl-5-hydroxy-6-metoxy-1,4-benzoquinol methylase